MDTPESTDDVARPFPALTPAQRYHFDVYGYVVVQNTFDRPQRERLIEALERLKQDMLATGDPDNAVVRGARTNGIRPHYFRFARMLEADEAFFDYVTHPWLVGMVEEVIGGTVRYKESAAIISSRDPDADPDDRQARIDDRLMKFHTGIRPGFGTYTENGLFHCIFVKALTFLTEVGPDDGGTQVIAGSHKLKCPPEDMIACANEDPSLVHQVTAPAGSTLLFAEALIHATAPVRSDRQRVVIIGGYGPMMSQVHLGMEPSDAFLEQLPQKFKKLITGSDKWNWDERLRTLDMPSAHPPPLS